MATNQNFTRREYRPRAALEWFKQWHTRNVGESVIAMSDQLLRRYADEYERVSHTTIPRVGRARIYDEGTLETIAYAKQLTGRGTRTIRDAMSEAVSGRNEESLPPLRKMIREELETFKLELLEELRK